MNYSQTSERVNTFGDRARMAIALNLEKILVRETGVIKDKDPEELHQMRVGMRRLRSSITGFAPAINLPKTASDRNVGKIARILGSLRDIDVLQAELKHKYQPLLPEAEQKSLDIALKALEKKRKQAYKEVKKTLKKDRYKSLKKDLTRWSKKPKYKKIAARSIDEVLPDLLAPQISKFLLHPGWILGIEEEKEEKIYLHEEEILHDLRKEAKRTRYNMDLFTDFYGDSYQKYLKKIKLIQEVLGEIQDCFVLRNFLEHIFGLELEKNLPTLASLLRKKRHEKWLEWKEIQQEFIKIQTRQDLRSIVQYPNFNGDRIAS